MGKFRVLNSIYIMIVLYSVKYKYSSYLYSYPYTIPSNCYKDLMNLNSSLIRR